jgi:hypothetical protein
MAANLPSHHCFVSIWINLFLKGLDDVFGDVSDSLFGELVLFNAACLNRFFFSSDSFPNFFSNSAPAQLSLRPT